MIITATTEKRFAVSKEWMKACGLQDFDNVFEVERIEDLAPGLVMVVLKSTIIGHGGTWTVDQRRGEFVEPEQFVHSDTTTLTFCIEKDKRVFGTWRAVTERRLKHEYRLIGGEVCVKYRREWMPVEERNPKFTDHLKGVYHFNGKQHGVDAIVNPA